MRLHVFSRPAGSGLLSERCFPWRTLEMRTPANSRTRDGEKSLSPSSNQKTAATWRLCCDTETTVARAFAVAYLLTADAQGAEVAVSEAADCWNPEIDSEEALVLFSAHAAARMLRRDCSLMRRRSPNLLRLPRELARIANLDAWSRGCFVLRVLMALPLHVCAELLGISALGVEERVCAALRELPQRAETEEESR